MELHGRRRELEQVAAALDRAQAGRGSCLLVEGDAGMGKTALVVAALERAAAAVNPPTVAWGVARQGPGSPPLWIWVQVLRRLGAPADLLGRLDGAPAAGGDRPANLDRGRFRLVDDICESVLDVPAGTTRVVVVDDLHWATTASVDVLAELATRVRDRSVLVLVTVRPDEPGPWQGSDLARSSERIVLPGLDRDAVGRVVADVTGAAVDQVRAAQLWQRTGGNPLFLHELALLQRSSGEVAGAVPPGVREVLDRRLARLPQPVVDSLGAAAVLGRRIDPELLAEVSGLDRAAVADALREARASGVVVADGPDRTRFAHDLHRDALLLGLGRRRAEATHLAAATALQRRHEAGRDTDAAAVASHLMEAGDLADPQETARWARAAADQAVAQFAHRDGIDWYRRALAALARDPAAGERRGIELLLAVADAERATGDPEAARKDLHDARRTARAARASDLLADLALAEARLGGLTSVEDRDQLGLLEEALDALDAEDDRRRARLLAAVARLQYHHGGQGDPGATAMEAVAIARGSGDGRTLAACLEAQHDACWVPGGASDRLAIATELVALAASERDLDDEVDGALLRYAALVELADPAADQAFDRFAHLAGRTRQRGHRYAVASRWAMQAVAAGRSDDADRLIAEAAVLGAAAGEADGPVVELNQRWRLCSDLGRRAELLDRLELFSAFTSHAVIWLDLCLARLAAGDRAGAEAALNHLADRSIAELHPAYGRSVAAAALVEAAIALDRPELLPTAREVLVPLAGQVVVMGAAVVFEGAADHHLGLIASALGEREDAANHLRAALDLHERVGARPWADRSAAALADVLGSPRDELPVLRRAGDVWTIGFRERTHAVKHAKGLADLAVLVDRPGVDVPAARLYGGDGTGALPGADPVLDPTARRAFAERIEQLDRAIERADRRGDQAASADAAAERAAVLAELDGATGLGGRARRLGDPGERARKAVTARIRDAIARIATLDPELGALLDEQVSTGTVCSFRRTPRP